MTAPIDLLDLGRRLGRQLAGGPKVESIPVAKPSPWWTPDWQLVPRIKLDAPMAPEIEFLND